MDNFNQSIIIQAFASFSGAFFAYVFLRLAEFFSAVRKRELQHYNSLVALDSELNEVEGVLYDNLYLIPEFVRVITSGNIYFNNLHEMPINKSHYENLSDLDLLNRLFSYNYDLRKLNDDIRTTSSGYRDIKDALIQKHISPENYKLNTYELAKNLILLKAFLEGQEEKTLNLLARVRIHLRKNLPFSTRLQRLFVPVSDQGFNDVEVEKEVSKLRKEIEETKSKSKEEIEGILRRSGAL